MLEVLRYMPHSCSPSHSLRKHTLCACSRFSGKGDDQFVLFVKGELGDVFNFHKTWCYNLVNIITVDITYNVIVKIEHLEEQIVLPLDSIFNLHWIFVDKSHKRLLQKIKFVTTINEFLIDKFSPEQEI